MHTLTEASYVLLCEAQKRGYHFDNLFFILTIGYGHSDYRKLTTQINILLYNTEKEKL